METLSQQISKMGFDNVIINEEKILDNVCKIFQLSKINYQANGTKIDCCDNNGDFYQVETPFRMVETGNHFLEKNKFHNCKNIVKWWIINRPLTLDTSDMLYLILREEFEKYIVTSNPIIKIAKSGDSGYIIASSDLFNLSTKVYDCKRGIFIKE